MEYQSYQFLILPIVKSYNYTGTRLPKVDKRTQLLKWQKYNLLQLSVAPVTAHTALIVLMCRIFVIIIELRIEQMVCDIQQSQLRQLGKSFIDVVSHSVAPNTNVLWWN